MNGVVRAKIALRGVVQGVGFRPFVYRLARELGVHGWVNNTSAGLFIEAEASRTLVESFLHRLRSERPTLSRIVSEEVAWVDPAGYGAFDIRHSDAEGRPAVLILPDIAVCGDCLREMNDPADRRYRYPFINCTNCGPRYSIIRSLPYDRPNTTMDRFPMCPECEREYRDPADRRFHAQPTACPVCGPHVELWEADGTVTAAHYDAVQRAAGAVCGGRIVAMKGLGGFQLLADAANDTAVRTLRERKRRDEKPFAVMFPSMESVRQVCIVSEDEERLLRSPESPILLIRKKEGGATAVSENVAPGNPFLGVMLPYTPLHHLLMSAAGRPVVATSGNVSDEPMCTDERQALTTLGGIADLFLVHDRPIHRYVDDSVVRIAAGRPALLRRARGYAPLPLIMPYSTDEPVLALGGHLKSTVALQDRNMLFVSQHIGDLETLPALECLKETVEDVVTLYDARPSVVLHDRHPNYASTSFARNLPQPKEEVQHHFAHIASAMAENELEGPVFGAAWDGTGYGLDGAIWGGEFIRFDGREFTRFGSLREFPLPGGDAAVKESARSAAGLLYELLGPAAEEHPFVTGHFGPSERRLLLQMMEKRINTPRTTSMGRLFDAVGALLGLRTRAAFEGQTAMAVEWAAMGSNTADAFAFGVDDRDGRIQYDWADIVRGVWNGRVSGRSAADAARMFHTTVVDMLVDAARRSGERKVVLSGGCFQNVLLLETAIRRLREEGFVPYWHQRLPANDGGIAAGQLYYRYLTTRTTAR